MLAVWAAASEALACVTGSEIKDKQWVVDMGPGERWTILGSRGLCLEVFSWEADKKRPKLGTVVLFHGIDVNTRFEYLRLQSLDFSASDNLHEGLNYERSLVAALNAAGFNCLGADMQGFGLSQSVTGDRAYFERFEDLVDDAELVCRAARDKFGDRQLYLLGCSYGGLLAATLAARLEVWRKSAPEPPPVECSGIILLAPAVSVDKFKAMPINSILLPLASFLSDYAPTLAVGDKPKSPSYPQISGAVALDAELPADSPHRTGCYTGNLRARVGKETLDATERFTEHLLTGDLNDLPALIVHSKHDTMCDPEGSVRYADANASATLVYTQDIPGCDQMWHCLTQEPGADVLFHRVATWLEDQAKRRSGSILDIFQGARIA